jgi:mevalonate kinase
MADSVYFGDMMRTLHEILDELKLMNKKLDDLKSKK